MPKYLVETTYANGSKHIDLFSEDFVMKNFLNKVSPTYRFFRLPDDLSVFTEVTFELQIKEKTA